MGRTHDGFTLVSGWMSEQNMLRFKPGWLLHREERLGGKG
jgi:hypothetical protein